VNRDGRVRLAAALSVAGPLLFTLDWVLDGWAHRGYSLTAEPISALSAHDASAAWVALIGQFAFVIAFVALSWLVWKSLRGRGIPAVVFLLLTAVGTTVLSVERTICTDTDRAWCTPLSHDAYPDAQWAHGIGTSIGFVSALVAMLLVAWAAWPREDLHPLAVGSLVAEAIALPCVYWFLVTVGQQWHGLSEKIFLTTIAGWTAVTGIVLAAQLQPPLYDSTHEATGQALDLTVDQASDAAPQSRFTSRGEDS
jgi:Protein of unknown function (DUF998)